MHVHIVDPSAYTPPYDHFLAKALAGAGADVELYTSRFAYGAVPAPSGYTRHELFYRRAHSAQSAPSGPRSRARLALKLAEHVPDMLRYRHLARFADIVHFQWLTVQPIDVHLLPRRRGAAARGPRLVLTAHDILPREPRPGQIAGQRRLYRHFDAIVVHSEYGRRRLVHELGMPAERVHVIPHGVLTPWDQEAAQDAPAGRPEDAVDGLPAGFDEHRGPVVLFFGLLRPYKGIDVLLDAWRSVKAGAVGGTANAHREAELWIVGMERMDTRSLRAGAPADVRFLRRFISDAQIGAFLARASLVVLPYRDIDASGAAFRTLGAGVPLLLSDAGGFPEIAAGGAARTVPAGDSQALAQAIVRLLGDDAELAHMAQRARAAAHEQFGWEQIARRTLALYDSLLSDNAQR
ncbi:MAG: glycosyltransferase family 4 protein [Solirubrobacteraceae bacterium]